jgi:hypothetical protein
MANTPETPGSGAPEFEFRRTVDPLGIVVLARVGSEYDWKRTTPLKQDQLNDAVESSTDTNATEG